MTDDKPTREEIEKALTGSLGGLGNIWLALPCLRRVARAYLASLDAPAPSAEYHSVVPCSRGSQCSWPACAPDCPERPGSPKDGAREAFRLGEVLRTHADKILNQIEDEYPADMGIVPMEFDDPAPPVPQEGVSKLCEHIRQCASVWNGSGVSRVKAITETANEIESALAPLLEENARLREVNHFYFVGQAAAEARLALFNQENVALENRIKELEEQSPAVKEAVAKFEAGIAWRQRAETAEDRIKELEHALDESVKLQAHYAQLLNDYDGGRRIIFASSAEWIDRLAAAECPDPRDAHKWAHLDDPARFRK